MIRKLCNFFLILITSGILFHRSTIIGILCGVWVYFGAPAEENAFDRLFTPDLYLFTVAFLIFYRLLLKKTLKPDGDLDLTAMFFGCLGDFAWAVIAMFCSVFFFMMLSLPDKPDYSAQTSTVVNPQNLMKSVPRF